MRYVLAVALVLAFAVGAYAEETVKTTSQADWNNSLGNLGNKLRETTSGHDHEYTDNDTIPDCDQNFAYGPGVDLVVYESDPERTGAKKLIPDEVTVEGRYDFANQNGSGYVVAKYNVWDILKKKDAE